MKLLGGFLERFSKLSPPERIVLDATQACIQELYTYETNRESIRVEKDSLVLAIPSVLRQEVLRNKKAVLACINKKIGSERIFELR